VLFFFFTLRAKPAFSWPWKSKEGKRVKPLNVITLGETKSDTIKFINGIITIIHKISLLIFSNESMTEHNHALETPYIRVNTLSDSRNVMLTFIRTNKYKVGLNLLSNHLRAISKCIPKNCILQTKNQFKTYCKINLIQKGLLLLWIRLKHAIKLCRRSVHCLKIYQYQRSQFRSAINDFLKICIMLCVFVQMISHNKHSNQIKINISQAAFMHPDPKSAKRYWRVHWINIEMYSKELYFTNKESI